MHHDFDRDRGLKQRLGASLAMLAFGLTLLALLIVVSGLVASLAMTQVWQLVLLWGVVIGLGTGMTALVLGATIAARWFVATPPAAPSASSISTPITACKPPNVSASRRISWPPSC